MELNVDIERNSSALKISKEIYVRILRKAIEQTGGDLVELRRALDEKDCDVIQKITHRVKGDFANLRIDEMSGIARTMNDMLKTAPADITKLGSLYEELQSAFGQLQRIIPNAP